jgi:hypothetical protein
MHIQTSMHTYARSQNQNAKHGTPNVYKWKICTRQSQQFCLSHEYSREYLLSLIEQRKIKFLFASMYTTDVYSKSQNLDLRPWQLPFWPEDPSCRSIEVSCTSHSGTTKRLLSASLHLQGEPNRILTKIPQSPALYRTFHWKPCLSLMNTLVVSWKKIVLLYLEQSLQFNHQLPFLHSQIILCQ